MSDCPAMVDAMTRRQRPASLVQFVSGTAPEAAQRALSASGAVGKAESALEHHLAASMALLGLPEPEREYRFHPTRRWRMDFAWPSVMLAVEIEGGIYRGGGHTHVKDLKRDMAKGNAAALLGWRVLRFHGDQVRSGEAVETIRQALTVIARPTAEGTGGE